MEELGATLIVIPVLDRAQNVAPLLASIEQSTPERHRVLFAVTPRDRAEIAELDRHEAERIYVGPHSPGDYARKINAAYEVTTEAFLFCGADDLRFHPGWLAAALRPMIDPSVGVVGTNDLGNARVMAGLHSTHSLVRRSYIDEHGTIDEPGKVLHEGYWHEFVDDEFVQTAMSRGAWGFAGDSHVEHMHPNWGKAPTDGLYDQINRRMRFGRRLYWRRQELWGGNPCPAT